MPEPAHCAIFLSYAREDTAAARRIAEALRSQGIEVWFDQNELRGGDAWDQTIRRQIKECALFVPIISEHTQERGEGYFRLEWKLAVERTHLMAEGVPFLAPTAIDDTAEASAAVPPEFLRVQWTRLPGALPTPEFVAQAKRLLAAPRRPAAAGVLPPSASASPIALVSPRRRWVLGAAAGGVLALGFGLYLILRPAAPPPPPRNAHGPKSILVLPFANLSADKDSAYFADGIHEDVVTNLALVREIHVPGSTTARLYRGTNKTPRQIGEEQGVAYLLEASLRREGNRVRVNPKLIRTDTEAVVWSQPYTSDLTEGLTLQAEIATAIARELRAVISPQEKALIVRTPTTNHAAYDLYLQSRALRLRRDVASRANRSERIRLVREAAKLDPNFAKAWAELAVLLAFDYVRSGNPEPATLSDAAAALERAVSLAPEEPEVIVAQGRCKSILHGDNRGAQAHFERALQLFPNHPESRFQLGASFLQQLRWREALEPFRETTRLDPGNGAFSTYLVRCLRAGRRYDELQAELRRRDTRVAPRDFPLEYRLGYAAFEAGGSTREVEQFFSAQPSDEAAQSEWIAARMNWALATGNAAEYARLLQAAPRDAKPAAPTAPYFRLILSADARRSFGSALFRAAGGDLAGARSELGRIDELRRRQYELFHPETQEKSDIDLPAARRFLWCELARWEALLGQNDDALLHARMAVELKPESRNEWDEPFHRTVLAFVYAWTGDHERAIAEYARLLRVPWTSQLYGAAPEAALNLHVMKHHPAYAPLRGDARFQALLNDPKNNAPLF
jgi:TolB-like protein